ncbi:MAG: hypothetical protein IH861_00090 [Chloroflexi bacterium]|nr:hypothetical protein [Chloroflexota bacterium]
MSRIYVPAEGPEDWKQLLADPQLHWKKGYSARTLAYCWEEDNEDFPVCVRRVFEASGIRLFERAELLLAFPEYKVHLPGGSRPSQNDIFVLGKGEGELISITIEGKVSEPFGPTVEEWNKNGSPGKQQRLAFLLNLLGLKKKDVDGVRYQLMHRTASALIEAQKFNAKNAMMLVHSFSQSDKWIEDYRRFVELFGLEVGGADEIVGPRHLHGVDLYFGWVRGDKKYLLK